MVVGIDLGTTYSAIAYMDKDGVAKIIPNREGQRTTASVILFEDNNIVVGETAKENSIIDPLNVVQFVKRNMGNKSFRFDSEQGEEYGSEELSAIILKRLKADAEAYLGEEVTQAVITVPAYFDDTQRKATIDAGKIAGLDVLAIINEPTAAALAYGMDKSVNQRIMVYDLGGGTFDVTIMDMSKNDIKIKATSGDRNLGGFDIDNAIIMHVCNHVLNEYGIDLMDDDNIMQDLRIKAEKLKKTLSNRESASISFMVEGKPIKINITREQLKYMIKDKILDRTADIMDMAREDAGISWSDIDKIIRKQKLGVESEDKQRYNFVFVGNPGTGKTTVARLFAKIFKALGIIKDGHLVEVDRAALVGEFIGQTALKTKKAIEDALGGVLFVDEAYTLAGKGENDFGKEALETLLKAAEDYRGEMVIILAGYYNEMYELMEMNPGLKSRFNKFIYFEDYTDDELLQIAKRILQKEKYYLTPSGEKAFKQIIEKRKIDEKFGNAREVEQVVRAAIENKALNIDPTMIDSMDITELQAITAKDFGIELDLSAEDRTKFSYKKLDELIGLANVKYELKKLISFVNFQKEEMERGIIDSMPSLHMAFLGNPGTGKSTVAKIISEIYRDLGILKKGHLVTAQREDLVAEYVGQTAKKTAAKIKEAYGGILFIDEAYSLISSSENDFGKEAIATLIKEMEDNRDKLVVILAGYTDDMERLFDANYGFRSRISNYIEFYDYTPEELFKIFKYNLTKEKFTCKPEVEDYIRQWLQYRYEHRDKNFGNAREVRKLMEQMKLKLAMRVQTNNIQGNDRRCFVLEDVPT